MVCCISKKTTFTESHKNLYNGSVNMIFLSKLLSDDATLLNSLDMLLYTASPSLSMVAFKVGNFLTLFMKLTVTLNVHKPYINIKQKKAHVIVIYIFC